MNRNRNHNQNRFHEEERQHVVLPDLYFAKINEPRPVCSICGEQIEAIAEAITEPDGSYSHFDCVLEKLKQEHNVHEPDKISYVGSGNFAVVSMDEEGKFTIKEKISYESIDAFNSIKKFVDGTRNE